MKYDVRYGDLLAQDVDAIVNSWNRNVIPWWLLLPQGVSGAIKRSGGTAPFKELSQHGPIPLGEARLTGSGELLASCLRARGQEPPPSTGGSYGEHDSYTERLLETLTPARELAA